MRLRILSSILCLIPVLSQAQEAPPPRDPAAGLANAQASIVPFELLRSKHFAVQVTINGKGPFRVIFDTGAPVTLLNNRIAREAQLRAKPNAQPVLPIFGMRGEMTVDRLEMGELRMDKFDVVVMDHPALATLSRVLGPVDGIVGFPFFCRYRMTIDYQAERLTFVPVAYEGKELTLDLMMMMMEMANNPKRSAVRKVLAPSVVLGVNVARQGEDVEIDGVEVTEVVPGSAADKAGLRSGDRLLELDGTWTDSVNDCYRAASHLKSGREVKIRYRRGGQEFEAAFTPYSGL